MSTPSDGLYAALLQRGLSRRTLLKFGAAMAAALALPLEYAPRIVSAIEAAPRTPLIWLHGQACTGNSQAFLQSANPTIAELLVSTLSVDYDEALTAGLDVPTAYPTGYLLAVDGAIPTADQGVYGTVGGRPIGDVLKEAAAGSRGTIAVGSCAFDGAAAATAGGQTGAVGVGQVIGGSNLVNLPGCPVNVENLAATIVHFVTFGQLPPTDNRGRPFFAYGGLIHNQCERRPHFEYGEFVTSWGDEAAQKGWCLYKMGCKGPETFANCPTVKYADGASWNVLAGHGCIGCTMPGFWDTMGGAYERLPAPIAYAPNITTDQLGMALVAGVGALTVVHGSASTVRQWRNRTLERRRQAKGPAEPTEESEVAEVAEVAEVTEVTEVTEVAKPAEATVETIATEEHQMPAEEAPEAATADDEPAPPADDQPEPAVPEDES